MYRRGVAGSAIQAFRLGTRGVGRTWRQPGVRYLAQQHGLERSSSGDITDLNNYPSNGTQASGFTFIESKRVPELELAAIRLKHDKTGAEYLHIARQDNNNVFSVGFRTNPPDHTGVPHILEHTTLCGSEKYPIRDPFFKMLPRTLANFMNAFTASDHTFYPFATTNRGDFANLMSVYLDATLHPLLKESDFQQEGWRVGPVNPQALLSKDSPPRPEDQKLVFKGVVYNEMKGQMSDAGYYFYIRFQDHIFPAINNSGGDPQQMTNLTYEQLRNFHAQHYHPSNAKFFTYGDIPLEDHMAKLNLALETLDKARGDTEIRKPISLDKGPQEVTLYGPIDPLIDENKQYKTSVSWILGDASDVLESFSLSLISALLMDGYGSPLYKALIETGLGTDWSPNTGYDSLGPVGLFTVGLTGVQEADVPKVKEEVQKVLRTMRESGFSREKIDGYLNQLEISRKHKTANFGSSLLQRLMPKWFVGVDPFNVLEWNRIFDAFEAAFAQGDYLEGLIDRYLLTDKNFTFTMAPSATFGEELAQEEEARLAAKISEASSQFGSEEVAKEKFVDQELRLLEEQTKTQTEDVSCLPTIHIGDIQREGRSYALGEVEGRAKVQFRCAPTNQLTYFRAINVLKNLPDGLRSLIPLFTDAVMRLGTHSKSMEALEDLIKLKTGGLSVGYHLSSNPATRDSEEGIFLTGMAFDHNVPVMYDLLRQLVVETNFDSPEAVQQIRQLLQASADGVVNDIASSGHSFARRAAEASLTVTGRRREQVSGLSQVKLVTSLAGRPESDQLDDVIAKLKEIQKLAGSPQSLRAALTCGPEESSANGQYLDNFLASLPGERADFPPSRETLGDGSHKVFFPLPYQVYYGALAMPCVPYTSRQSAPLQILSQLLTHKHLHHEIREKGGAYGGGAYYRPLEGVFGFYSYRDPNPVNTLSVMRDAGRWAVDRKWTDRDLEEAKISVFQAVDAPRSVNEEGMDKFLHGITDEMKQARREQLLDVTAEQIREVAQEHLVDKLGRDEGRVAFIGEQQNWVDQTWKVEEMGAVAQAASSAAAGGASD